MASYNSLAVSSIPLAAVPPDSLLRMGSDNPRHTNNMDTFEHSVAMHFNAEAYLDDLNHDMPPLSFVPSYDVEAFSNTFDDPFSYQAPRFDSPAANGTSFTLGAETSFDDLENKLLSFSTPLPKVPVLELDGSQSWPAMTAELNGMFSVAEDVFGSEAGARPMELTCYRRNLFQISGTVALSRSIAQIVNEQGQQLQVYGLQATLSAIESIEGKSTEIITVPWKTLAAGSSEDKTGTTTPEWSLDLSMNPELDPTCVSIPIDWKRLQFKHATANNGRRKGLQQHYVIQINLMATLATGEVVKISEIRSSPVIVRGRNPGNFGSSREVPLSEKKLESKPRTLSTSEPPIQTDLSVAQSSFLQSLNAVQQPLDLAEWNSPWPSYSAADTQHRQAKRPTLTSQLSTGSTTNPKARPPLLKTRSKTDTATPTAPSQSANASNPDPINLSLSDDNLLSTSSNSQSQPLRIIKPTISSPLSKKRNNKTSTLTPGPNTINASLSSAEKIDVPLNSPTESADPLYEYFPLSIDDWMPPVDAIYRPHVVHHTAAIPDATGQMSGGRRKMKRYFSTGEDE